MAGKGKIEAIAYLRTSSAANVGADKDSEHRQREAIETYAKASGYELVAEYYDAAVSGADAIEARPGFAELLERIESNGVRTIIVEDASRFARDLIVQETGYALLKERGVDLIAADSPGAFLDDTPTAKMIRQILGAVREFEKTMLVAKLRGARQRKARKTGAKVEGRKSLQESRPEIVKEARRLARKRPKGGQRSLRDISAELAALGHTNSKGRPFGPSAVRAMLNGPEAR